MKNIPRPEFPRPQFERSEWINLNGEWTYEFDFGHSGREETRELFRSKGFDKKILVPFCPESRLSGVGYTDFIEDMWYHRTIRIPAAWSRKRILLHFGAVDYESEVYLDGQHVGEHFGGSVSFLYDITRFTEPEKEHQLVVRVHDVTQGARADQPIGKQCRRYRSSGCSYTRTTGIWQTVWLEAADPVGLESCHIVPAYDDGAFHITPRFYAQQAGTRFRVRVSDSGTQVAEAEGAAQDGAVLTVKLSDPKAWSPESPFLYDLQFEVLSAAGTVLDSVKSYAGLRKIHVEGNRIFLNNKPLFQRLVLDQGFYPDGIWTAPSDEALKHDIELSMAAGFNGARLHQKIFEERFHYWADKLGYLTWAETPSWGCDPEKVAAARNFIPEWAEAVVRDRNHPSIIAWTPFNEAGVRDLPHHRRTITEVYQLTKFLDPTRPVNDSSGWCHFKTDLWTVHNYDREEGLRDALGKKDLDAQNTADGKNTGCPYEGQPYLVDEFGGLKWIPEGHEQFADNTWGYGNEIPDLETLYGILQGEINAILDAENITGFCYTQLTDVEQEQNGIYNYDRSSKFDMERIRKIFTTPTR